ncbi:MAG TPA: DUF3105 domain-containing protein [Rubrobacteraceae bacterium]|nr:DUF3105 domain-containing protein [Rubrobacteraceae bacterium]
MSIEGPVRKPGTNPRGAKFAAIVLVSVLALAGVACGAESSSTEQGSSSGSSGKRAAPGGGGASEETTAAKNDSEEAELARARVGKKEITNMIPADGKKPDTARLLPEDPPRGIEVYPATTNRSVKGPVEYDREPPTNGDHAPIWQTCGLYEKPVQNRYAVHSLDHGVVWITYRPDLPERQVDELRPYGGEAYVIVSPYPGQDAPVIATSWRVQLKLDGAGDPRLRKFVDQFRVSELAPLSGNRCAGGVGRPAA